MLYGSASLHDVPWEILIKDFRAHLGTDCCDHLGGYSQRFFEFIQSHPTMLPRATQRRVFFEQVAQVVLKIVRDSAALEALQTRLQATAPEPPISATKVERAVEAHVEAASIMIIGYGDNDYYPGIEEFECHGFLDRQFIHSLKSAPIGPDIPEPSPAAADRLGRTVAEITKYDGFVWNEDRGLYS